MVHAIGEPDAAGKDPNTTTQGFYTAPPDGAGYGWVNTHDPRAFTPFWMPRWKSSARKRRHRRANGR
jgi:hypothetical protein